jgi:hypothetical protein
LPSPGSSAGQGGALPGLGATVPAAGARKMPFLYPLRSYSALPRGR